MDLTKSPMGWNSWDCYGATVTEEIVRNNAKYMADNLLKCGYEYIVIDIQWSEPTADSHEYHHFTELCMDEYSRLIPAENKFPSSAGGKGFKPLADYIHSLGLKFGIHIMRGIPRQAVHRNTLIKGTNKTAREIAKTSSICAWNTDMYGVDPNKEGAKEYYESIFELYASWGVDFIKCDDIARELPHEEEELIMLSRALKNCGRDMILSISPGPAILEKSELYKDVSNMWRITDDFWDEWPLLYSMFERAEKWCTHTGYGNWPDADMLPVGPIRQDYGEENYTKFTKDEQITMMSLWSVFRAPLIIGGEMTRFDDFTLKLLTNEGIIKMHNEIRHSHQVCKKEINGIEHIIWTGVHKDKGQYVVIFNTGEKDSKIEVPLISLEIENSVSGTELWSNQEVSFDTNILASVKSHGAVAYYFE